jgi:hypothetical protein
MPCRKTLANPAPPAQNTVCGTPTTTYLGVSPPSREGFLGGAANPLAHDASWQGAAYAVCHNHLEALRELDSRGASFLRSASVGDVRLLLGSPEFGLAPEVAAVASGARRWPPGGEAREEAPAPKAVPFACTTRYFAV